MQRMLTLPSVARTCPRPRLQLQPPIRTRELKQKQNLKAKKRASRAPSQPDAPLPHLFSSPGLWETLGEDCGAGPGWFSPVAQERGQRRRRNPNTAIQRLRFSAFPPSTQAPAHTALGAHTPFISTSIASGFLTTAQCGGGSPLLYRSRSEVSPGTERRPQARERVGNSPPTTAQTAPGRPRRRSGGPEKAGGAGDGPGRGLTSGRGCAGTPRSPPARPCSCPPPGSCRPAPPGKVSGPAWPWPA